MSTDTLNIHFYMLGNGAWGIVSPVMLPTGEEVTVNKKDGSTTKVIVEQYHSKSKPTWLGGEWKSGYVYTITKKFKKGKKWLDPQEQTETLNNKPKFKKVGGVKAPKVEAKYEVFVWAKDGDGWTLETHLESIPKSNANAIYELYKDKDGYRVLAKNKDGYNSYDSNIVTLSDYAGNNDIYDPLKYHDTNTLYKSYLAKKDIEENKERLWIECAMTCPTVPARAQKIKGILELGCKVKDVVVYSAINDAKVVSYNDDIENVIHKHPHNQRKKLSDIYPLTTDKFIRPCPETPEHGYVDSRLVHTPQDLDKIIDEIKATGQIPEFIIMDKIDCPYSGVITPDSINLGLSNDGATQGDNAFYIPFQLSEENREYYRKLFWKNKEYYCTKCHITYPCDGICPNCGVNVERKMPYAEVLYQNELRYPTIVQLRSGPSLGVKEELIKVKEVIEVNSAVSSPLYRDLIAWGKEAKMIEKRIEGGNCTYSRYSPIVWHPNGAPSSHYGVWATELKIPYTISNISPTLGELYRVGVKNPTNISAIREGLVLGTTTFLKNSGSYIDADIVRILRNFIGALHLYPLVDTGNAQSARFIGYSWALGARVISALPFGEMTHRNISKDKMVKLFGANNTLASERDYTKIWKLDIEQVISGLIMAYQDFLGNHWSGNFGGPKWAECTLSLIEVFIAIRDMMKSPTNENMNRLVSKTNEMVNMAHNGGWWLDKMLTKDDFDNAVILPHFYVDPNVAFKLRGEYEAVSKSVKDLYQFKVNGFKVASRINVESSQLVVEPSCEDSNDVFGKPLTLSDIMSAKMNAKIEATNAKAEALKIMKAKQAVVKPVVNKPMVNINNTEIDKFWEE